MRWALRESSGKNGAMTQPGNGNGGSDGGDGEQHVMVVGPDGRPLGMARVPQQSAEDGDDEREQQGVGAMVEQPAKVMRIGTMIKQLLEEVRSAPLDDASRLRLREHPVAARCASWRRASRPSCATS